MKKYILKAEEANVHGSFSNEYKPVLTIESGDSVEFQTLDIGWGYSPAKGEERVLFKSREKEEKPGHPILGPVAINGAKPGMVLEVKINDIVPGWYGWNVAGGTNSWQNQAMGLTEAEQVVLNWELDVKTMTGRVELKNRTFSVGLSPFMGLMAVAPAEPGVHSTIPPRLYGGNIDCKELVRGSSLFLPIGVEGALFSVGDGHAVQGDGEISGTAIECPMELVDLTFVVRDDMKLNMPRANTPSGWVTFGFSEDLNEAAATALAEMNQLIQDFFGVNGSEASGLMSVAVDLRVTQVVNGVKGVHAVLPHGAIR